MNWPISAFADEIDSEISIQFQHLNEHGIGLLDLRSALGKNVMHLSDEEVLQVKETATNAGIGFNCVGSPVNKVKTAEVIPEEELAKLKRAGEVAKLLGINRIRIFTPESNDWDEVKSWMGLQIAYAKEHGLLLMHENDARYYGAFPENAKRLFGEFGSEHFRAAFDFANSVQIGFKAMDDWFPWLLPHLETIHIKDAKSGKVVPAGEGDGQVVETLAWLKEQGWNGVLSIEPHLQLAGDRGGFSGTESFGIATNALKEILENL
jgi:sugar phosphate isomerase/epimerase